jgi:hypothetical protein
MLKLKYFLIPLLIVVITHGTKAQEISASDFIKTTPPKVNSAGWYQLDTSGKIFKVDNDNGRLKISLWKPQADFGELRVKNGILKGIDKGEWGGCLLFINGRTHKIDTVTGGNIHLLFEYEHDVYFIDALAHMSFNKGTLYKLRFSNGKYIINKVVDFEDAPQAICILGHDLLIASFSGFYQIHNSQKTTIFKDQFWWGLSPWSLIAINDKEVYMGITGGYVKLDLVNKRYVFYKFRGL